MQTIFNMKKMEFTAEKLKDNLLDALQLVLDYKRKENINSYKGRQKIRRKLNFVS